MNTEDATTSAPVDAIVIKRVRFAKAFQDEIKCWKLSIDEDAMLRAFAACVAVRMKGENPEQELGLSK